MYFHRLLIYHRNPINSIRHQFAADLAREERDREERQKERDRQAERERSEKEAEKEEKLALLKAKSGRFKRPLNVEALNPSHSEVN